MGGAARARGHGGPRRRHVKGVGLLTRNATTSTRAVPERVRLRTMASMERADANPRPPIASAKDFGQVCSLDSQRAAQRPRLCAAADAAPRACTAQLVPFGDPVRPACARAACDRRGAPLPSVVLRHAAVALYLARRACGARDCDVARTCCCVQRLIPPRERAPPLGWCSLSSLGWPRAAVTAPHPRGVAPCVLTRAEPRCRPGTAAGTRRTTTPATTPSAPRSALSRRRKSCPTATSGTRPRRCRRSCSRRRPPPAGCPSASATGRR